MNRATRSRVVRAAMVAASLALSVGLLAATPNGRQWLHDVDAVLLGERVRDTLGRLRYGEDWSTAPVLRLDQDYAWLRAGGTPIRIAHALGESTTPTANTLGAATRAHAAGFRLLEVDLVEEGGELLCQHDPGPRPPAASDDTCTFETLIQALPPDTWVVLDIKTDFASAGQRIVNRVKDLPLARRMVFQLYRPQDVALFKRWQSMAPLPGPILTTYLAHRRMDYLAAQAARIGVRALTLPLDRRRGLSEGRAPGAVLVHPVHDCADWAQAMKRADGVYMLSALHCGA